MNKRKMIGIAAGLGMTALLFGVPAQAADPGPHGCVIGDGAGNAMPTVYPNSGTSQIGGSSCTYVQVAGADGGGGGYVAAAASWSITSCVPVSATVCTPDPDHSYSSSAGSAPVGMTDAIPTGDQVSVTVSNGVVVAGTPDGA